jgi:HEAT repeat protein
LERFQEVVATIVRQLTDEDVRVRRRAAGTLAEFTGKGYHEARPILLEGLRGEDRAVRKA